MHLLILLFSSASPWLQLYWGTSLITPVVVNFLKLGFFNISLISFLIFAYQSRWTSICTALDGLFLISPGVKEVFFMPSNVVWLYNEFYLVRYGFCSSKFLTNPNENTSKNMPWIASCWRIQNDLNIFRTNIILWTVLYCFFVAYCLVKDCDYVV